MNSERKHIIRECRKAGWTVFQTRSSHLVFISPTGVKVWASMSPSDRNAERQLMRDLRRIGGLDLSRKNLDAKKRLSRPGNGPVKDH